jgi:hypothetical protein
MPIAAETSAIIRHCAALSIALVRLAEFFIEPAGRLGIAAARGKSADFENPNPVIEGDRDHIAAFDPAAGRPDLCTIDPHMAGGGERCRGSAGAHHPGVP